MKKICLINVWYGKFNNFFLLWYLSAKNNPTVDFYIVTDNKEEDYNIEKAENIHFVYKTFAEVKSSMQALFDFKIKLETPYKLCDYKPLYGLAFPEIVQEYDLWGHIDLDVILGDIRSFLTEDILSHDKIFDQGIFTLYQNNEKINNLYLKSMLKENMAYPYKAAFRCNYACYFDEYGGMNILGWKYCKVFRDHLDEKIILDFSWRNLNFTSYLTQQSYCCKWENGKLYRYSCDENGKIIDATQGVEYMLIHIQKRQMEVKFQISNNEIREFWIVPNEFTLQQPVGDLNTKEQREAYTIKIKKRDRDKSIRNMVNFGIIDYVPHFFRIRRIVHWIQTVKKFF